MSGRSLRLNDDLKQEEYSIDPEELQTEVIPMSENLTNANDARRRLEEYWEQKALQEELKHINGDDED